MWYGGSESKLRARFEAARAEPGGAVVVWDEAESMLIERGRSQVGVEDRLVALMLNETDGFVRRGQDVLFILITNQPEKMDHALRRSGRAVTVTFERPDAARTRALFETYLRDVPCRDTTPAALARDAAVALFGARDGLGTLVLRDGSRTALAPAMVVSGALVRSACERGRRRTFVRAARSGDDGQETAVTRADLLAGLAAELAAVAETLSLENVRQALTLPPGTAEQIVSFEPAPRGRPALHFLEEGN
jgi:SpoVK/Ycf46/Vps4 family AAA+-type ATPase